MRWSETHATNPVVHNDPLLIARCFSGTRLAPVWVAARLYVGWAWLAAGWLMLHQTAWMAEGTALRDAWIARDTGAGLGLTDRLVTIGAVDWIARATAVGLTFAGIAVLLGLATGVVSFVGILLSVNVIVTDTTQLGPEVFAFAVLLVLAWKTSGWIGLDRWLLPLAGAPWQGGFEAGSTQKDFREPPHETPR